MTNLFHILTANGAPAAPFLQRPNGAVDSYADLQAHTARYAHALRALGVRVGDRVAVQIEKSPENLYLYLAVVRAGAVFLPLNTAYTLNELDYFIGDAGPSLVVCDPAIEEDVAGLVDALDARVVTLDANGEGSLADIAAGTHLYRYFELDIDRPSLPHVEDWYGRLRLRPAYTEHVMIPFGEMKGRLAY